MSKKTSELNKILPIEIANRADSYVIVDSDELNLTGKMRFSDLIKFFQGGLSLFTFKFTDGNGIKFSDGNELRINHR